MFKLKGEVESWSFFILWNEINCSFKLCDNHFAYDETKSDPVHVYLPFFVFDWSEKFKEVVFVSLFDADAIIDYWETNFLGFA